MQQDVIKPFYIKTSVCRPLVESCNNRPNPSSLVTYLKFTWLFIIIIMMMLSNLSKCHFTVAQMLENRDLAWLLCNRRNGAMMHCHWFFVTAYWIWFIHDRQELCGISQLLMCTYFSDSSPWETTPVTSVGSAQISANRAALNPSESNAKGKIRPRRLNWPCSCCSSFLHFSQEEGWSPRLELTESSAPSSSLWLFPVLSSRASLPSFRVRPKSWHLNPSGGQGNPLAERQKVKHFILSWKSEWNEKNFSEWCRDLSRGCYLLQSRESQWGQLPFTAARGCWLSSWGITGGYGAQIIPRYMSQTEDMCLLFLE